MTRRHLDVFLFGGLCGLAALIAEHLTVGVLTRYLRRQGL